MVDESSGPLAGVRVLELAGQGPGPYACSLLAGLGAEVVSVRRPGTVEHAADPHSRGRRVLRLDLKEEPGMRSVLGLLSEVDVLLEGFRPGVAERLGLGPDACLARNPRLVYGRMTGWGQEGPLAQTAGHDINYLALSGALGAIGPSGGAPVVPLNLIADYGAGGPMLALGVLAALQAVRTTGRGQVVDAAMVDGLANMLAPFHAMDALGAWSGERGSNLLDGGAPFYGVYETADGGHVAVGAIEPPFYAALLEGLGIDGDELPPQMDRDGWPAARARIAEAFSLRSRDEWAHIFADVDACVTPVLDLAEARSHPHTVARALFSEVDGMPLPAPAPRVRPAALEAVSA